MLQLLFVGGGPHSLATLTRLLEPNPDPGVDAPRRHVNATSKVLSYWQWQRTCPAYRAALTAWLRAHVAVVDPSGAWMMRWHQQFSALGISHLRSTTAVHPDPFDSVALATYASATKRTAELLPLQHIDKSRDFSGPFAVPGASLFHDFCTDLVQRYCLEGAVMQDKVLRLTPVFATPAASIGTTPSSSSSSTSPAVDHWQVQLASGRQLTARRVVLGIGSTNMHRAPDAFAHLQPVPFLSPSSSSSSGGGVGVISAGGGEQAKGSNSNAGSECCSGCCDGACSSSSGWSADSTATAAAAPAKVSSSRSEGDCDSLCSWLELEGAAQQQQQEASRWQKPAPLTIYSSSCDAAGDASLPAAPPAQALETSPSDSAAAAAAAAAEASAAAAPGPCHWVSAASSPTSGCDSLCSWLGCEHTAATAAAVAAAAATAANEASQAAPCDAGQFSSSASSSSEPAANSYPWGRLMHAWQLVEALQQQQQQQQRSSLAVSAPAPANTGSVCGLDTAGSASSSSCGSSSECRGGSSLLVGMKKSRKQRGKRSSSSKGGAQVSAVSSSAQLLRQRGLLLPGESVLIIGGGLTSAHLASLAAAAGGASGAGSAGDCGQPRGGVAAGVAVTCGESHSSSDSCSQQQVGEPTPPVSLLLRESLRVKQFDVDIEWMGRNRGSTLQFGFRQVGDMQDRLALMRRVLQGGSVTPEAAVVLADLQRRGVLGVREGCEVLDAAWDWQQQRWDVWLQDGQLLHADRIWLATGSALSAQADSLLAPLLQQLPVPLVSGLPALQPNLEWAAGSGLFVLGAYAALQLGPGALNLAGAKTGSVVMAQQLRGALPPLPTAVEGGVGGSRRGVSVGGGRRVGLREHSEG